MSPLAARRAQFESCVISRDAEVIEGVLDPAYELVLVHPALVLVPRDRWLAALPDYVVHGYHVVHETVAIDGDVAVAHQLVDMQATVGGVDRSGLFVLTDVWRERLEGWRLWRRTSTPLAGQPVPGLLAE